MRVNNNMLGVVLIYIFKFLTLLCLIIFSSDNGRITLKTTNGSTNGTVCNVYVKDIQPRDEGTWNVTILSGQLENGTLEQYTHYIAMKPKG